MGWKRGVCLWKSRSDFEEDLPAVEDEHSCPADEYKSQGEEQRGKARAAERSKDMLVEKRPERGPLACVSYLPYQQNFCEKDRKDKGGNGVLSENNKWMRPL